VIVNLNNLNSKFLPEIDILRLLKTENDGIKNFPIQRFDMQKQALKRTAPARARFDKKNIFLF